ncbi:hypothetical protein BDY21DRAFT_104989 [Lineolata rhizophorae]|uniref:Uncharacterized protein n=1 Tax=Lineolata rhizophorae TaxID=578093 RepID=A0A6A6NSK0_9PEZI|nr:hypothetical protein BDY21DRAFT_104989 [Lineolata rhizophorae]
MSSSEWRFRAAFVFATAMSARSMIPDLLWYSGMCGVMQPIDAFAPQGKTGSTKTPFVNQTRARNWGNSQPRLRRATDGVHPLKRQAGLLPPLGEWVIHVSSAYHNSKGSRRRRSEARQTDWLAGWPRFMLHQINPNDSLVGQTRPSLPSCPYPHSKQARGSQKGYSPN